MIIQSFQDQEKYEHVGPKVTSTQDGKRLQDDDKRLYLADDLKKRKDHMQVKLKGTSSSLKSKDRYAYHKLKDKDSRPRAKTEDIHEFLTDNIRATPEYRETPTPTAVVDDVVKKKKRKQVTRESSLPNDNDTSTRINPESHKENSEIVDDDDDMEEKKDDKKDDDNDDDDNNDHTDHTLVKEQVTRSLENRKDKMQTPIPSPLRSIRPDLSLDKNISQNLTTTISPILDTTS
ncbi:hypothetical protein Tco_0575940 [Tanacetum coccineum]